MYFQKNFSHSQNFENFVIEKRAAKMVRKKLVEKYFNRVKTASRNGRPQNKIPILALNA